MFNSIPAKATILIADDDEINRELLSEILTYEGYTVILAADGEEALDAIHHKSIDLAILDVLMPKKTGSDVYRIVKSQQETRFIPVVLVTGLSRVYARHREAHRPISAVLLAHRFRSRVPAS